MPDVSWFRRHTASATSTPWQWPAKSVFKRGAPATYSDPETSTLFTLTYESEPRCWLEGCIIAPKSSNQAGLASFVRFLENAVSHLRNPRNSSHLSSLPRILFCAKKLRKPGNYNRYVARGWESKSVEAQQAEAAEPSGEPRRQLTEQEAVLFRQKETLRLSRQRVLKQLEISTNPRHRKLLQDSLADLDDQLSKLGK
jgi:hypothetical protein